MVFVSFKKLYTQKILLSLKCKLALDRPLKKLCGGGGGGGLQILKLNELVE